VLLVGSAMLVGRSRPPEKDVTPAG
jgi:hypothetical protein